MALAGLLLLTASASATTNLFVTQFEVSEGYDSRYELVAQNGWNCYPPDVFGGNGLIADLLPTQAAYIGLFPLDPATNSFAVYQPLNFSPNERGLPLVTFSVSMAILDSSNTNFDDFAWTVYNANGTSLFTLDFYNYDWRIYYATGASDFIYTGFDFTNAVSTNVRPYTLTISMDFGRNLWSATLSGTTIVTNLPIASAGEALDLADVDAIWFPADPAHPGDNFMVFDNYRITADARPMSTLTCLGRDSSGQTMLRLNGPTGARYAIEGSTNMRQWTSLKTNLVTDGSFDFIDTGARSLPWRLYRARQVF